MNNVLLAWVSRYFKKEKIMIFVKNKLVYIRRQKMHIFGATLLPKDPRRIDSKLGFLLNLIQILINVLLLGGRPYIHSELHNTLFEEFLQSRLQDKNVKWNWRFLLFGILNHFKACSHKNSIQVENNMENIDL